MLEFLSNVCCGTELAMAKTAVSKREAQVLDRLGREGRPFLDLRSDRPWLEQISDDPKFLVHRMRQKGLLHTVQRGRYVVNLQGDATATARLRSLEPLAEAVLGRLDIPYYVSWHSALWHHGLIDQQSRRLYVAVTKRKRPASFSPWAVRFVTLQPRKFFGYETVSIGGATVSMATVEKAIIDSFDQPRLAAQPAIVANALLRAWTSRKLDSEQLVADAIRFGSPTLNRRLGFFMTRFGIPNSDELSLRLGKGYAVPLAPGWEADPDESHVDTTWGVVVDDELVYAAESPK
jgi:predicted transcriptional regulator of viral defense system